jgi:IS5 family transposase
LQNGTNNPDGTRSPAPTLSGVRARQWRSAASVRDSQLLADLVDGRESDVVTDNAYDSRASRHLLAALGVLASIMRRARACRARAGCALSAWQRARNRSIGRLRNYVEGGVASVKRYLGCRRAAYRGLERVML